MITSSIDLDDRLINGQFGIVFDFGYVSSSITKVYLNWMIRKQVKILC